MTDRFLKTSAAVSYALLLASLARAAAPILRPQLIGAAPRAAVVGQSADAYVVTRLFGSLQAQAVDVSNSGAIGGIYLNGGLTLSFVAIGDRFQSIQYPGAEATLLGPITNSGVTVGNFGGDLQQHATLYDISTGLFHVLPDITGKPINLAWRINDAGTIVGSACGSGHMSINEFHNCTGWTWDGTKYTFFDVPWATDTLGTFPTSINNRGQIVGYYSDGTGHRSFLYEHGVFAPIEAPEGLHSETYDINNSGQILVWVIRNAFTPPTPMIYDRGSFSEVPTVENAFFTLYSGLNDAGDLAGFVVDFNFNVNAVLATRRRP